MVTGKRNIERGAGLFGLTTRWASSLFLFLGAALTPMFLPGGALAQAVPVPSPPSQLDNIPHFQASLGAHTTVREASRNVLTVIRNAAATEDYDRAILKMEASGSSIDYGNGTPLSSDAFGAILSLSYKAITGMGATTFGAFVEGGTGSYDTENFSPPAQRVLTGNGDAEFIGGGLFLHNMFTSGTYFEISARAGSVSNNYGVNGYSGGNFDISTTYYGAHLGMGQILEITDLTDLDVYGQFHWTYTDNKDFRTEDRTAMRFDGVDSYRARLGARLTQVYLNGDLKGYVGAAWEYEIDGEAGGRTAAGSLPGSHRPDLGGSNAFGEAGLIIQPVGSNYAVDLGIFGVGGEARGVGGTAGLKFEF